MKTLTFLLLLGGTTLAQTTQRVSVETISDGPGTLLVRMTPDGRYVAFGSSATNLVPGDTNGARDVFVRDFQNGTTELVSVGIGGVPGNGDSNEPAISSDGRFVTFWGDATNLVPGDTNAQTDVFVRDRLNGTTEIVSVSTGGTLGNGGSFGCWISSDGRFVSFTSAATNLVPGDTNGSNDVFVRDRLNGTTERVSVANGGTQSNDSSFLSSISSDGRYVAFESLASNLVNADSNGAFDIFVRDRVNGTTELVSLASDGTHGNDQSRVPSISTDGRYVAFMSKASNLVAGDTNGAQDIFVRDRQLGTTERVSVSSSSVQGNAASGDASISADGRYVAFDSAATNLVPGDTNGFADIFVRDRQTGTTELASTGVNGVPANNSSATPAVSADGRYVAFESTATNLLPLDSHASGVLRRDRQLGVTDLAAVASIQANSFSDEPSISADGSRVAFRSNASNLVPSSGGPFEDVFVYDRPSASLGLVSQSTLHAPSNGSSYAPVLSSDGRFVAFESDATNLVAGDGNSSRDIFVHDCQQGTTERVSFPFTGADANSNSYGPSISADGRYVAFQSDASNLVAGDTNGVTDIFVSDRLTSTMERVSVATGGAQGNQLSEFPSISADGRYVAFSSYASNLVAGDTNGTFDVFVHDRQTGATERVSVATGGTQSNDSSYGRLSISADGRFVAFLSMATNLVPGDTNGATDVFVHDRVSGTTERVSIATNGAQANLGVQPNFDPPAPSISGDGRYVSFQSTSTNLVPGDTNGAIDVFLRDRVTGKTERVSIAADGSQASDNSDSSWISGDGRYIVFRSDASNLVPNDTAGWGDVFLRDRGATSVFSSFCFGDGSAPPCPCGNNGVAGRGCQNSAGTGGALLSAVGSPSLASDTVVLTASSELPTALSIVLQGNAAVASVAFGDGLRCAGGSLKRLYSKHAVGGILHAPELGDPTISARSAALGDTIPLGATRIYQVYYRDANLTFCPGGFNVTTAIAIAWGG